MKRFHGCVWWCLSSVLLFSSLAEAQEEERWERRWESPWDRGVSTSAPACSLDLRAGRQTRAESVEWFGVLSLRVPWEGCLAPARPRASNTPPEEERREGSSDEVQRIGEEGEQSVRLSKHAFASPPSAPSGERARLESALISTGGAAQSARSRAVEAVQEPTSGEGEASEPVVPSFRLTPRFVRELVERALESSGLTRIDAELGRLASRSRLSGMIPELRLRGAFGWDQSTSLAGVGVYSAESTLRDKNDLAGEVRLTFRLNRLLYDDGEPGLERLRLQLLTARRQVSDKALELLFDWYRARQVNRDPEAHEEERAEAELRESLLAARLHVLTGGWFLGGESEGELREKKALSKGDGAQ